MKRCIFIYLLILAAFCQAGVNKPQLKWSKKGGGPYLTDGSYAGSPAVADLDGDGKPEVIWANYMIYVVDGATGSTVWNFYTGHDRTYSGNNWVGRTYPGVVVADIDGDKDLEIVTAHEKGWVAVYDHNGYFHSTAWPQQICPFSEFRSLCVADLDMNGQKEILLGSTRQNSGEYDWYILKNNGQNYSGWPQTALNHCSHGAFHQNMAVADMVNDGHQEIVALADVFYVHAIQHNGDHLTADEIYGGKIWADIPVWLNFSSELRGWGDSGEYRPKFSFNSPIIVDVNNDDQLEVVIIGNICDPVTTPCTPIYHTPIIFEADRTRFNKDGFDWHSFPVPSQLETSAPLCTDWQITKVCLPNPVTADLDNDGFMEILFAANDGKMHVYWLDKTEHHNWPFWVNNPDEGVIRFATEPIVVDLDNDGAPEVIFGSWTEKNSQRFGKLHILDRYGNVLHELTVPETDRGWNGITSAPTIANIDDDPDFELVVGTGWTGICAYDLPGSANAKIYWGTGQCNYQRTGSFLADDKIGVTNPPENLPDQFSLWQNYPNPFNAITTIPLELTQKATVILEIYDLLGRKIEKLFQGNLEAGKHCFNFPDLESDCNLHSGVYLCRLKIGASERCIKMVLLR